jgi:hypothetical protein
MKNIKYQFTNAKTHFSGVKKTRTYRLEYLTAARQQDFPEIAIWLN